MSKLVFESLNDIFKPKNSEEIHKAALDYYGFVPDDDHLILTVYHSTYIVNYYQGPDGRIWRQIGSEAPYRITLPTTLQWIKDLMTDKIATDRSDTKVYKENYKVFESVNDILKPKNQEEIYNSMIKIYGFIPDDNHLIIDIRDERYPSKFYQGPDGNIWVENNIKGQLSPVTRLELLKWIKAVMNGKIKLTISGVYKENYKEIKI